MFTAADSVALRLPVSTAMESSWHDLGFTVPNPTTYPFRWLWDSCFHSLVWMRLGRRDRAVRELTNVFVGQNADGLIPHMWYADRPAAAIDLWSQPEYSTISQPPMYGHAIRFLAEQGVEIDPELAQKARRGLAYLIDSRLAANGLAFITHPWESGCDDSPRWDSILSGPFTRSEWRERKLSLIANATRSCRSGTVNVDFEVYSIFFTAMCAFNIDEFTAIFPDEKLAAGAAAMRAGLAAAWRSDRATWVDAGATSGGSAAVRTAEVLATILATDDRSCVTAVAQQLLDQRAFAAPFGPCGVHRSEPSFDPTGYWRGGTWAQISYLIWLGLQRHGHQALADLIGTSAARGALRSGLSEWWQPDTGEGFGAVPQSWTGLALLMAPTFP